MRDTKNIIKQLIKKYQLISHIEGGYFHQVYKSKDTIKLPKRFGTKKRSCATSIYYLLTFDDFSTFHRIKSDETWYFHHGSNVLIHILDPKKRKLQTVTLGDSIQSKDAVFQFTILAGNWFAAELQDKKSYALVSCAVAPSFEYEDFEIAKREELLPEFKKYAKVINRLTRE